MTKSKSQIQRFKEAARELEADDDTARYEARLGKISKPKPPSSPAKPVKKATRRAADN